jgi:hypothetical protein
MKNPSEESCFSITKLDQVEGSHHYPGALARLTGRPRLHITLRSTTGRRLPRADPFQSFYGQMLATPGSTYGDRPWSIWNSGRERKVHSRPIRGGRTSGEEAIWSARKAADARAKSEAITDFEDRETMLQVAQMWEFLARSAIHHHAGQN